jgi:phosphoribosylamine-glycine ligase
VLRWRQSAYAVGVVIASKGYPESSSKGDVITGKEMLLNNDPRGFQFNTVNIRYSYLKFL